jgi:hypothetical protein
MASKEEYSKLSIEDTESNSSTLDATHDYLCQKCSTDIEGVRGISRRRIFAGASIFQICVYVLLLTANLGTIAIWLRTAPTVTDCIRPVLAFSMMLLSLFNEFKD